MTPAERQKRRRQRQRRGIAVFHVDARENRLIEAMLRAGRISERNAMHRRLVEEALSQIIDQWIAEIRHA